MDRGVDKVYVEEKKARVREVINRTLDRDRQEFMNNVGYMFGMTSKEVVDRFAVNETRVVRDMDRQGSFYNVHSKVVLMRKQ